MAPDIDQHILDQVPDDLIRPLLALCMRTLRYNSFTTYEQLLQELRTIRATDESLDVQLLWSHLTGIIRLRMRAMQDAKEWLHLQGQIAEPTEVYVNRWYVGMMVDSQPKGYLVSYTDDGIDYEAMERKSRAVVREATEDDSVLDG
jgi:hypothetical protein